MGLLYGHSISYLIIFSVAMELISISVFLMVRRELACHRSECWREICRTMGDLGTGILSGRLQAA